MDCINYVSVIFILTHIMEYSSIINMMRDVNGNPLQYSCLENPRDGEAWWPAVYGVAQSRTRLTRPSSSSSNYTWLHIAHILLTLLKQVRCLFFSLKKGRVWQLRAGTATLIILGEWRLCPAFPSQQSSMRLLFSKSQNSWVTSRQRRKMCKGAKTQAPESVCLHQKKTELFLKPDLGGSHLVSLARYRSHGKTRSRKCWERGIFLTKQISTSKKIPSLSKQGKIDSRHVTLDVHHRSICISYILFTGWLSDQWCLRSDLRGKLYVSKQNYCCT